jgi:hypothetical protein
VSSQPREGVICEAIPFNCRIKRIASIGIAGTNGGFATNGVIRCGRQTGSPLSTGVNAYLTNDVNDRGAFHQSDRIVAIEPTTAIGLICLRENRSSG